MISDFIGEYFFLSNFYPCEIYYSNFIYKSVENAYNAAKVGPSHYEVFQNISPYEASRLGRKLGPGPLFEINRYMIMEQLVRQKFADPDLKQKLIYTGDLLLQNKTLFGDLYWGIDTKGVGLNRLGDLLMEIRDDFKYEYLY